MSVEAIAATAYVYMLSMIAAWWVTYDFASDSWGQAARALFWPAFLVKGLLKVLRAAWRELLS